MDQDPRLTHQTLKVLRMFMNDPVKAFAGSDIAKETRLMSGTLYPILARLEKAGWLTSEWEVLDPSEEGRPRKRHYQITALGQNRTNQAFSELGVQQGRPAWSF
jgi:DNA-binding PadR family transcriptional regulator